MWSKSPILRYMTRIWTASIAAILLVIVAPADYRRPATAATCRFAPFTYSAEALDEAADKAELILIGAVTSSAPMPDAPEYRSAVVQPESLLKGELPPEALTLSSLSRDCMSHGPPLYEGERVLLVISRAGPSLVQYVDPFVGKTVFEDNQAFTDPSEGKPHSLGDAETAVRRWASAAGASEDATDRAILAATGTAPASQDSADVLTIAMIGVSVLAAAAVAVWYWRRITRRSTSAP